MKKLLLATLLFGPLFLHAQTAINLSGSNVTCAAGTVEVGELTNPCSYTITNNTGSTFNWLSTVFVNQAYPFTWSSGVTYAANYAACFGGTVYESLAYGNVGHQPDTSPSFWANRGTCTYMTVAYDGDARARTWGESCNPNRPSANQWTWATQSFAAGATCNMDVYLQPSSTGASTGHVYLLASGGTILSTITVNGSGTAVPQIGASLPASFDTTYTAPASCTTSVSTAGNLTTALAAAHCGDRICIPAGTTITGNFTLPAIAACSQDTFVTTANYASLPAPGTRVAPGNANFAKVQDSTGSPVFTFADGARYWRILGLDITSTAPAGYLVGSPQHNSFYSASLLPVHVGIDRSYLHTTGNSGGFGISIDGSFYVLDSYIALEGTDETQGINPVTGNGPIKIVNNYIQAVGENIMFGGADTRVANTVPSDATITGNYVRKLPSWNPFGGSYDGISRSVKNLMELKKCVRCLIDGNIFENNWTAAQDGSAILFEPANQSGSDITLSVRDITFTNNIIRNVGQGFNHVSSSYAWASRVSKHFNIQNNLWYNVAGTGFMPAGSTSYCFVNFSAGATAPFFKYRTNISPGSDYTVRHNDCLSDNVSGTFFQSDGIASVNGMNWKDNLTTFGTYGLYTGGYSDAARAVYWPVNDTVRNLFTGGNTSAINWNAAGFNFNPTEFTFAGTSSVGFVDAANSDFRLSATSPYRTAASDGKQYGADVTALNTITACVVTGACGAPTNTFSIAPTSATINVNATQQMTASSPAWWMANSGTIDSLGVFTAPGSPAVSTITGTQMTLLANDLNTQSNWQTCGNCGDTGGPSGQPNGTFTMTAGNPATFSAQPGYAFNNGFWYYVMGTPGQYNSNEDFVLSFDVQFPTQAAKNASQAIEFELQKNVGDNQYNMAWQACFACGNKWRVFNKNTHAWEDSGIAVNPLDFAGGKWATIVATFHLTTGSNTRHTGIGVNGVWHPVAIDHAPTPAVESDYLHPAFQLDTNSTATPYSVLVRNFDVATPTGLTATAQITSQAVAITPTIAPASATIGVNGTIQFTTNGTSGNVWSTTCGTISQAGFFTAPASANSCTVTVKNSSNLTASAVVTVVSKLNAIPAGYNFGGFLVGQPTTSQFVIQNLNTVPVSITAIAMPVGSAQFVYNAAASSCKVGTSLPAQSNCSLQVTFTPTSATSFNGNLRLTDQYGGVLDVPLTGQGLVPSAVTISPTSYAWGSVATGATYKATFTVSNFGAVNVQVTGITVSGTGFSNDTTSSCVANIILSPNSSCVVVVAFAPVSAVGYTGTLQIVDNSPNTQNLALTGTGVTPATNHPTKFKGPHKFRGAITIR